MDVMVITLSFGLQFAYNFKNIIIAPVETWFGDDDFGKVRSNGFNHPGYPLSNLFDGNKHSTYISRIFPRFKGAYVEVDFDGPVIIEEIILTTRSNTIRARDRSELINFLVTISRPYHF